MANNVEFKVIVTYEDGQAKVKIEDLTDALNKNSAASKGAASSTRDLGNAQKELNEPLEGSIGALERQNVELLKKIKNQSNDIVESKRLIQIYRANSIEIQRMTKAIGLNNQANIGMISNTGLAGATLTEFGRTLSDAPYGIQGMANNMSQLTSLFTTFVSKTEGGLIPALKQLKNEFIGPLGIVVVVQAAIAAWEWYSSEQKKAEKATEDVTVEIYAQRAVLDTYIDTLENARISEERRSEIINKLIKEVPTLKKEDFEYGKNLEQVKIAIDEYILSQANKAEMERLVKQNSKLLAAESKASRISQINDRVSLAKASKEFLESEGRNTTKLEEYYVRTADGTEKRFKEVAMTQDEVIEAFKDYKLTIEQQAKPILKQIESISEGIIEVGKSTGDSEKDVTDFLDKIYNQIELQGTEQFEKRRIQAKQEYDARKEEIEAVLAKESDLTKEEKERLSKALLDIQKSYNKELDLIKEDEIQFQKDLDEKELSDKEKQLAETAKEVLKQNKHLADKERSDRRLAAANTIKDKEKLQEELDKIDEDYIKRQQDYIQTMVDSGLISTQVGIRMIEALDSKLADIAVRRAKRSGKKEEDPLSLEEVLDGAKKAIDELENLFNAQFDADISREEAKTEKMNNELKKRLRNESLTAKQREGINAQIAASEEALQLKRDEIAERNFKLQKAISIGQALISTYEMANRAFNAVLAGPEKFLGISALALAKVAAGVTTAFGLAQVRAIARQQFVPSALSTPSIGGGGASAPAVQAPDFNIVGQSGINQLSEALQAQSDKPVKAYVVSKDISTAQELDRNKVLSSGL